MGYYTDYSKSTKYAAKDTALYNRINGTSSHSWGAVVSANTMNIFNMAASLFDKYGSNNNDVSGNEPEENSVSTDTRSKNISNFTAAMKAFGSNPTKENAQKLKEAYEADPENPTINRYWRNYEVKVNETLKNA